MSNRLSEVEQLKIIYQEVVDGCSYVPSNKCYIKHFNELDHITLLRKRIEIYDSYIKQGVPSEADKLKECIANEEWTQADEDSILNIRYLISDNERNLHKLIPEQQPTIAAIIKQKKQELFELILRRKTALGMTADDASEKDVYYFITYFSSYRDVTCKTPFFDSYSEFEEMDEDEIAKHSDTVQQTLSKFQEHNIRKIAALPFFLNTFSYSKEAIHTFLNKPLVSLTNFQMLLFSLGSRNINILSQATGEPPEMLGDVTPQQIVDWYDQQYSIILGRRNSPK